MFSAYKNIIIFNFFLTMFLISNIANSQMLRLSTTSDSALYYYYEGWRHVMDRGDYTSSEYAYRKMLSYDPDFLVGMSLLGRITRDLNEREEIESLLEQKKNLIRGDESKLLENYFALVKFTNLRETDPLNATSYLKSALSLIEVNLRQIVHTYPGEVYYLAEYIEVLHRNYGASVALDSLHHLSDKSHKQNPFLIGYTAHLEAELGMFTSALKRAKMLEKKFKNDIAPKPFVVYADIYFVMGKKEEARKYVDRALDLDPGNIDAQRLKKKIL
jgi:tetratricopeptide (TPR) repeat protein